MDKKQVVANTVKVTDLTELEVRAMYELMNEFYDDVYFAAFQNDLAEKDWVVVLRKFEDNKIVGFTTVMIIKVSVDAKDIYGAFSGDTIVHKDYWGRSEFIKECIRLLFALSHQYHDELYWFLICKGFRTYRILPVFLQHYYPRYDRPTPEYEKRIIDCFGISKYPREYSKETGVIHYQTQKDKLKADIGYIDDKRLKDPHITFFVKANPGYSKGEDIVCITKINYDNLNKLGKRLHDEG